MKKQILALSMVAALSGCDLDNSEALQVPATFNNSFQTNITFDGVTGETFDVNVTFGHGSASGTVGLTDVNFGEAEIDFSQVPEAVYGTFTMNESDDGAWTYDLDETNPEVAALQGNPDASLTDVLTITSLDGTTQDLTIIINGTPATSPAEFRGAFVANVSLSTTSAFGQALVFDENFQESSFQPVGEPQFGTFTISPDGRWEYELDNRHPDLQSLITPEDSTQETFTVVSADGTTTEFTVNITGAPLNFAVNIPSETDETSVFAIDFLNGGVVPDDLANGVITFRARTTEDLMSEAKFGMTCAAWNGNNNGGGDNRRLAQFFIQPDGTFEMWSAQIAPGGSYANGSADYARNANNQFITERVVFDQMFIPGEWSDFVMTWEFNSTLSRTFITLSLDDVAATSPHGAVPSGPNDSIVAQTVAGSRLFRCMDEIRFFIQGNAETGGVGAMLIDDIKLYTDINADLRFDTPVFEDSFVNSNDGDAVTATREQRYELVTTDNITVVRDL